ncbi:ferrous iron transport protein A [Clostridium sp. FP1]|uniref:FeoA family protein n=1 Tax=Clostridium sp. FP1 TaxID=2724076 RepID=UPI001652355B|nr:FeoA domain-containing protein [Clostridium sp. FP1]MBZ9634464.1 FeoA domain-containing protein [Clostridium sp. FP1]
MCIPLNAIGTGKIAEVVNIHGGEMMCKRLMEMGVNKGALIQVLKNDAGQLIIGLGKTRFVLGRGMAQKVLVVEVEK